MSRVWIFAFVAAVFCASCGRVETVPERPRADMRFSQYYFQDVSFKPSNHRDFTPPLAVSGAEHPSVDYFEEGDSTAKIEGRRLLLLRSGDNAEGIAFSPTGKFVAAASGGRIEVRVSLPLYRGLYSRREISYNPLGDTGSFPKISGDGKSVRADFGRLVRVDEIAGNFPAGSRLVFDGDEKSAADFTGGKLPSPRECASLEIRFPDGVPAPSSLSVFGADVPPFEAFDADGKLRAFADIFAEAVPELRSGGEAGRNAARLINEFYPVEFDAFSARFGANWNLAPDSPREIAKLSEKAARERKKFLADFAAGRTRAFVYVERYPIDGSYFGYTEALSDSTGEATFPAGSALKILFVSPDGNVRTRRILSSPEGLIRDPDVSYDGKKILFSWKRSAYGDEYHLYELDVPSDIFSASAVPAPRQLTFGDSADYEGAYLADGSIVFSSTRCVQMVDCYSADVSNLYMMNADASFLRRISFDQVHSLYSKPLPDGNIVYTRWDYSDRGQIFTQGLFTMQPDGTLQSELYGNKSWFPTSIIHARGVPNSGKIMAVLSGHHTGQRGKLALINPSEGTQEGEGITLLAPISKPEPERVDVYGQKGTQFCYPFPFSEKLFLVTFCADSYERHKHSFPSGLFLMDDSGRRELLASHPYLMCAQAAEIAARPLPPLRESTVDYSKDSAELFVRNVYDGYATAHLRRGSLKKIRIVKPLFERRTAYGSLKASNSEGGFEMKADFYAPIGLANASWDCKEILGEVPIAPDGSVHFKVPAREPVYFQVVDADGNVAVTMRSWASFQRGEFYSCAGCHGRKDLGFGSKKSLTAGRSPSRPKPFYDVGRFSFRKVVQPILDRHCADCHSDRNSQRIFGENGEMLSVADIAPSPKRGGKEDIGGDGKSSRNPRASFSLLDIPVPNSAAKRIFNDAYYNLLYPSVVAGAVSAASYSSPLVNWPGALSVPTLLPAYYRGAAKSELMRMLRAGHSGVELTAEELEKIACWIDLGVPFCGDNTEGAMWSDSERTKWNYAQDKFRRECEREKSDIEKELDKKNK